MLLGHRQLSDASLYYFISFFLRHEFGKVKSAFGPRGPIRPALNSGFRGIKRLGVFLLPPGWDASPSQGYPTALNSPVPICTPGWREAL